MIPLTWRLVESVSKVWGTFNRPRTKNLAINSIYLPASSDVATQIGEADTISIESVLIGRRFVLLFNPRGRMLRATQLGPDPVFRTTIMGEIVLWMSPTLAEMM